MRQCRIDESKVQEPVLVIDHRQRPDNTSNTARRFGSPPWATADSTAISGARPAAAGSVTTGTRSGPSTEGVICEPETPIGIGVAHQAASARSVRTTSSSAGQPNRAWTVVTYTGQLRRFRGSGVRWTSTTTANTGLSATVRTTTASARYSVGITSAQSAEANATRS